MSSKSFQNASKLNGIVSVLEFGAVGDNSTDDTIAFNAAISYCSVNQMSLHIPEGAYVFGQQLVIGKTFDITCDKTAAMRWTSQDETQCGILFDFQDSADSLCSIELPQLYSAGVTSSFTIPGYGPSTYTYNLNARYGNGIHIKGGNRINLSVHYMLGWHSAILLEATPLATVENINISANTIDFCVKGIALYSSQASSKIFTSVVFNANTVWAKYPIFFNGTNTALVASRFAINGQAFMNEVGACGIYASNINNNLDTCNFLINWCWAGYGADSTTGTPTTLICPYIGGDGSSNGQTTDGLSPDVGYFKGKFCEFTIGPVMGIPGDPNCIPTAGKTIRVRDGGAYNRITMQNTDSVAASPISTTTTAGEANYNGGIGGAQYSRKVFCSATIPALAPLGGTVFHYIYHQAITSQNQIPIKVIPSNSGIQNEGIMMYAQWDAGSVNRQLRIEFVNPSTTRTTTAGTYYFFIEV